MKIGQIHKGGEVHALRGGWWLVVGLLALGGRALCHTPGHKFVTAWNAETPENVTCNRCRRLLGLTRIEKPRKAKSGPKVDPVLSQVVRDMAPITTEFTYLKTMGGEGV